MSYAVKEIFYTLQGEGANAGRPAVFCRFAGCNLWSGREADRADAVCRFCDTDFVGIDGPGGGKLRDGGARWPTPWRPAWPAGGDPRAVRWWCCTGGEPLLQLDSHADRRASRAGFEIAVETNGTVEPRRPGIDWLCVSPKAEAPLIVRTGDELKLVYPQAGAEPERFTGLSFRHFFLQPMDGPAREANTRAALDYCLAHPRWRLSLQTHKLLGIP